MKKILIFTCLLGILLIGCKKIAETKGEPSVPAQPTIAESGMINKKDVTFNIAYIGNIHRYELVEKYQDNGSAVLSNEINEITSDNYLMRFVDYVGAIITVDVTVTIKDILVASKDVLVTVYPNVTVSDIWLGFRCKSGTDINYLTKRDYYNIVKVQWTMQDGYLKIHGGIIRGSRSLLLMDIQEYDLLFLYYSAETRYVAGLAADNITVSFKKTPL